jgi:hypothetical protein
MDNSEYHPDIEETEEKQVMSAVSGEMKVHALYEGSESSVAFDDDAEDDPAGDEEAGVSVGNLGDNASAVKAFFMGRLETTLAQYGGYVRDIPAFLYGWKVEVLKRTGGASSGAIDVFYYSPSSKRYRSRMEAVIGMLAIQNNRTLRGMSKVQLHDVSLETREKLLISQQLQVHADKGVCTAVEYVDDEIVLRMTALPFASPDAGTSSSHVKPYFAMGNIAVLSWGTIVADTAFQTLTQIYPLGFKCVRQEHDLVYDRIVDCFCEIDSVVSDGGSVYPLFRISIAWVTELNQPCVRVYEAKSPQLAWQAAMLEPLGVDYSAPALVPPGLDDQGNPTGSLAFDGVMDDEELLIRSEIRDARRDYFRALRNEQSLGLHGAMKPRLSIDDVDSFGDDVLLRMIEGMSGADTCETYQFLDSRVRDGGRKHILRCLGRFQILVKAMNKVVKKSVSKVGGRESQESRKRERGELQESRKRLKQELKESRAQKLTLAAQQKQKLKDLDKVVRTVKETVVKVRIC